MRMLRRLIGILVLVMVVLVMVQVVGAVSQTWYFTSEGAPPPWTGKTMTKGVEGGDTVITLEPKQRVWIFANEVAQCDVSFPSDGNWDIAYWVRAVEEGETGTVYTRVGYADSTGKTVRILHRTAGISHPTEIEEIVENGVAIFTVPEGGRLAIEVYWGGTGPLDNLEIHCNPSSEHASKATSPSSDPGYPVPELSTLILLSTGLLTLAGYVLLTKKRN